VHAGWPDRCQIRVLETLGFAGPQVVTSVECHCPDDRNDRVHGRPRLRIVAERLAWRAISNALRVETVQVVPLLAIAATAAPVLVVANPAAFAPDVSAARPRPSSTVRAE
jgi:hypothetical protein